MVRKRRGDVSAVAGWPHTCCSFEFIIIDYLFPSIAYRPPGNERKKAPFHQIPQEQKLFCTLPTELTNRLKIVVKMLMVNGYDFLVTF